MSFFNRIKTAFKNYQKWEIPFVINTRYGRAQARALYCAAFAACTRVKGDTISVLPARTYKTKGANREQVSSPLDSFLSGMWNDTMTSTEGIRWLMRRLDEHGNAYVYVDRTGTNIRGFYQMTGSMSVQVDTTNKRLAYVYGGDDFVDAATYTSRNVLHFKSSIIEANGYRGVAVADLLNSQLNMSLDMDNFYERVLRQGQHAPGTIELEKNLTKDEAAIFEEKLRNREGTDNAGKMLVLPPGAKFNSQSMTMVEADLSAQQKRNVTQICMQHGVPPYMIYEGGEQKYANASEASLNFIKFSITPIVLNIENVLNAYLTILGKPDTYVKFDLNGIMRGDFKTRVEAYQILVQSGIYTPNEIRAYEDMNPRKGGDYLRLDLNAGRILSDGTVEVPTTDKQNNRASAQAQTLFDVQVSEARDRIVARVEKDGPTDKNVRYAREQARPLALAAQLSGGVIAFDVDEFIKETTTERND